MLLHDKFHAKSVSSIHISGALSMISNGHDFGGGAPSRIESPELGVGCAKLPSYPLPLPPEATPSVSLPNSAREESVWKKGRLISRAQLGDVYCGFNSEKGGMCAIKEVPFSCDGDKKQTAKMLEKEIVLLSRIRHPNIVQYYGSQMVADNFRMYYEYMSRGSIAMILEGYGRLGFAVICSYTQQILSGLAYLHSKSIAHGGIKGANILIDPNGRVKLSNLGIEKQIAEKICISWLMDSPYWMAPEVIMNPNVHNFAVDIWSLGCTVLEMATAKPPLSQYDGAVAISRVAHHKELPTIPDHLPAVCKDFLRHCLRWDPQHRATASQLLEHPFVKGFSPLERRILVSTPLGRPAVANAVKSQGSDHARKVRFCGSSPKAWKSDQYLSDIYTPKSVWVPTSPTSLLHPRPPQQLGRCTPPPPKYTQHTASNSSTPIGAIRLNLSVIHQDSFHEFPKQSAPPIGI